MPDRDSEDEVLSAAPLLAFLATAAAMYDLLVSHGAVRVLAETLSHAVLLDVARSGILARNLAAVAGIVALTASLIAFLHVPRHGRITRGLSLAGFGGIFVPIVAVATVLPEQMLERRWTYLIVFAVGAGNVLSVLLALAAARRAAPHGIRVATGLVGTASFLTFASIALGAVQSIGQSAFGFQVVLALSRGGELAWLVVPIIAAITVHPDVWSRRGRIAAVLGVVALGLVLAAALWSRDEVGADFRVIVYGLLGTELFIDAVPSLYVVFLAIGVGIAVSALASGDKAHAQVGGAILLLYAAGFEPQAPARLLAMVLAAAMLARSSLALGARGRAARSATATPKSEPAATAAPTPGETLEELDASLGPQQEGSSESESASASASESASESASASASASASESESASASASASASESGPRPTSESEANEAAPKPSDS